MVGRRVADGALGVADGNGEFRYQLSYSGTAMVSAHAPIVRRQVCDPLSCSGIVPFSLQGGEGISLMNGCGTMEQRPAIAS